MERKNLEGVTVKDENKPKEWCYHKSHLKMGSFELMVEMLGIEFHWAPCTSISFEMIVTVTQKTEASSQQKHKSNSIKNWYSYAWHFVVTVAT